MAKIKRVQPIKSVAKTQEQKLQEAAELLMQDRANREQVAAESLDVLIKKWEKDYNSTFSITQPQIIVTLK
jgi:Holliday junction resolvase-like predicted endonuclease